MLRYNIVRLATTRVLTMLISKRSLKVAATSTAKQVKPKQENSISPKFILLLQNESDLDIFLLTLARRQKLAHQKSILKYFDDFVKEGAGDDLLGNNLLGNDLLSDNSPIHINKNSDIDTKANSNPNKDIIGNNLLEKNFGINIEDLF